MPNMDELRKIELFRDLEDTEFQRVIEIVDTRSYARGEYVFMEGEPRESVYFVQRGLIKVFKLDEEGREHIVNILGASQMFPHVGFFDDGPYPGTAEAMAQTTLHSIRSAKFEALLAERPEISRQVMRVMGQKILQLQSKLRELALYDARERVEALLWHFADEHGRHNPDGIYIKIPVTHSEMAQMIGMSRESVNRIWNAMRRDGTLRGDKDEWVVSEDWYRQLTK